jgi:hypothetical protein
MSTIKSSSEDLTLNADGLGKDIKFQSNGVEKASLTDAGVFTATSFVGSGASLTNLPAHTGNVAFPATRVASADANTLDDYEEGTWTPTLGGNTTYTAQSGYYTRVGNMVTVFGEVHVNIIGTGGSSCSGLPFAASNSHPTSIYGGHATYWNTLATSCYSIIVYFGGTSITGAVTTASQTTVSQTNALWVNNSRIIFNGTYPTDN